MSTDYDVAVIGSGAAGLAAAVAAADTGARVIVLDADTQVGGSSRLSGGHFYAAGTSAQRATGVEDSADAMFEHYMTLNQWLVEPSVVRRYCDLSGPTFEWALELGAPYPNTGLYCSGVGSTPRGHQPDGDGSSVVQVLDAARAARGVDLALDTRVSALLTDDAGAIRGIRSGQDEASCTAVVMASGGFGANRELLAEHYPDAAQADNWSWYIGSPMAQGDGLKLGQSVGAALDGHNRGLLLVTPGFSRDLEVLLPGWLLLVDQQGRRFANETAPYTVLGGLIQQHGGRAWAMFDHAAMLDARPSPISQAYWVTDTLQARAKDGTIAQGDSLEELATRLEIPPQVLSGTVARYNTDCAAGNDTVFFKDPKSGMRALATPPYYAAEIRPAIVCWTGAGLRINADTQVLNQQEQAIPGLYAAGETVGSLHGDRYIGGGGSFGPCIVFGKLAGEQAAGYANAQP